MKLPLIDINELTSAPVAPINHIVYAPQDPLPKFSYSVLKIGMAWMSNFPFNVYESMLLSVTGINAVSAHVHASLNEIQLTESITYVYPP